MLRIINKRRPSSRIYKLQVINDSSFERADDEKLARVTFLEWPVKPYCRISLRPWDGIRKFEGLIHLKHPGESAQHGVHSIGPIPEVFLFFIACFHKKIMQLFKVPSVERFSSILH